MIGDKHKLKQAILGAEVGAIGYVFNDYGTGFQVIFENGDYDGFSQEEQEEFLEFVEACPEYSGYQFKNVMQVSKDFRDGYWRKA